MYVVGCDYQQLAPTVVGVGAVGAAVAAAVVTYPLAARRVMRAVAVMVAIVRLGVEAQTCVAVAVVVVELRQRAGPHGEYEGQRHNPAGESSLHGRQRGVWAEMVSIRIPPR